jgi:hypothetical protein
MKRDHLNERRSKRDTSFLKKINQGLVRYAKKYRDSYATMINL